VKKDQNQHENQNLQHIKMVTNRAAGEVKTVVLGAHDTLSGVVVLMVLIVCRW
jgi:hypothetical protein